MDGGRRVSVTRRPLLRDWRLRAEPEYHLARLGVEKRIEGGQGAVDAAGGIQLSAQFRRDGPCAADRFRVPTAPRLRISDFDAVSRGLLVGAFRDESSLEESSGLGVQQVDVFGGDGE